MIKLHINVDHIATIRQARKISEPDPVTGAALAELGGANGITVHLREDRRHIQKRDVRILRETVQTCLNLEMAATEEMFDIACSIHPDIVTVVPEKREEVTTEGGLDVVKSNKIMENGIQRLKDSGIRVSLFINPEREQIVASKQIGSDDVELHTGAYSNTKPLSNQCQIELDRLEKAALFAHEQDLKINAGHGLNYFNIKPICHLPYLEELNIGHSIISRSLFVGITQAVKEMKTLIREENR